VLQPSEKDRCRPGSGSRWSRGALLPAPDALQRYSARTEGRLQHLADADDPSSGTTTAQYWAIGQALLAGLQIYKRLAPGIVTQEVFERAFSLLAGLHQEQ